MAYWDSAAAPAPRITTGAFGEAPLDKDSAVITLFYGDPDADIPTPPSVPELAAAGAPAGGDASTTTRAPADGSTTGADHSTPSTPPTGPSRYPPPPHLLRPVQGLKVGAPSSAE